MVAHPAIARLPWSQNIWRHGETLAHLCHHTGPTHFLWVRSQPTVMWHSSAAPQTLLLQPWVVTSHPWQLFAGLCPKSHFWALPPPISACFPAESQLMLISLRNSAQTPRGFPGDAVTPKLWLSEQANGSLKQAHHPPRAVRTGTADLVSRQMPWASLARSLGFYEHLAEWQLGTDIYYVILDEISTIIEKFNLKNPQCFSRSWRKHNQAIY